MSNFNIIEYKNYPRTLGFYSKKHDKIYITPLAQKYPILHKYLMQHETDHYRYSKYPTYLSFFLDLYLDWIDLLKFFNLRLVIEQIKCTNEYIKLVFSDEEINDFKKEFLPKLYTKDWFIQKLYENFRFDGYIVVGLVSYFCIFKILKNVFYSYIFAFIMISYLFFQKNIFEIKNIFKKIFTISNYKL